MLLIDILFAHRGCAFPFTISFIVKISMPETLPLTAFERLQFWESQPGNDNQILAVMELAGTLNVSRIGQAAAVVLPRHPLTLAQVELQHGRPRRWRLGSLARLDLGSEVLNGAALNGAALNGAVLNGDAGGWETRASVFDAAAPDSASPSLHSDGKIGTGEIGTGGAGTSRAEPEQEPEAEPDRIAATPPLPHLPPVHPGGEYSSRIFIQCFATEQGQRSRLILQTHHMACDGVGGLTVIRELLQVYHQLCTGPQAPSDLPPLSVARLKQRGRWFRWESALWWKIPVQSIGLFGATKFLFRSPLRIGNETAAPADNPLRSSDELRFVADWLSVAQSRWLRHAANRWKVTVNSLLLAVWLISLADLEGRRASQLVAGGSAKPKRNTSPWLRLMIPVNQRQALDRELSACNRVSLVYVDRRPAELEDLQGLAMGINYEMSVMRRLNLTQTFSFAMSLMNWMPGLLRWHSRRSNTWATSYVTNVGPMMEGIPTASNQRRQAIIGDCVLEKVSLLPPLRNGTPIALAVCQYAKRIGFTVHYNDRVVSSEDAQWLMQRFLNQLKTLN